MTNDTISVDENDAVLEEISNETLTGSSDGEDSLGASAIYFDASASSDGDGSQSKPYKYLKSNRLTYGSTAYFANGVYEISSSFKLSSSSSSKISIIGQSKENTIFKSKLTNKFDFTISSGSNLLLRDITFDNVHINNQAKLEANNVIFKNSVGFSSDKRPSLTYCTDYRVYDATYGGVIICDTPLGKTTVVDLNNCNFMNNNAVYGGSISLCNSSANIQNCIFSTSTATSFGGAIYSRNSKLTIRDSEFRNNEAKYGGVLYLKTNCSLQIYDSQFYDSEAYSFGGVISSDSGVVSISNCNFNNSQSLSDAGGVVYARNSTLNVDSSVFSYAKSYFGGAICNLKTNATILGSDFLNTEVVYYGGAIFNIYGNIKINNNVFSDSNAGLSGGAIFCRLSDSLDTTKNTYQRITSGDGQNVYVDGDGSSYYNLNPYSQVSLFNYTVNPAVVVPSAYDSRDYGYVTPAKNQGKGGNCWAFSGISTLETCLKKATGIAFDFSEENAKNLMAAYSLFGWDMESNSGGNLNMFIAYLTSWFGPINDSYDVYDDYSSLSVIYNPMFHIQNVYILPNRADTSDNDLVKKAIMDYGAVSISVPNWSKDSGHAISLIGWDDEYTGYDYFNVKSTGAWIFKNSWGDTWEDNGCFYLSYGRYFTNAYTFIFNEDKGYSDIYQYDFAGLSYYWIYNSNPMYYKNSFVSKSNDILTAVSTYFYQPTNYTVSIYQKNKLVTTQKGYSLAGYYTIPLKNEIQLAKGDEFTVQFEIYGNVKQYVPVCSASKINSVTFGEGISFYSSNGNTWYDVYKTFSDVAGIKAFTRTANIRDVTISVNEFTNVKANEKISIVANIPKYYDLDGVRHYLNGLITFTINDNYYYAQIDNGKAYLNISFNEEGKYVLTAQYKTNMEISNKVTFNFTVGDLIEDHIRLDALDVSKYYGGSEKYVLTVTNNNVPVSGASVKLNFNNQTVTLTTNSAGQVLLDLNMDVGFYSILAEYAGTLHLSKVMVKSTISTEDSKGYYLSSQVKANFLDSNGNLLINKGVIFQIGNYTFNAITAADGNAVADINLGTGLYDVTVINPITGERKQSKLEIFPFLFLDSTITAIQNGTKVVIGVLFNEYNPTGYVNISLWGHNNFGNYVANIENGKAILELNDVPEDEYMIISIYEGDDNFIGSVGFLSSFTVVSKPCQIMPFVCWSYYGLESGMSTYIFDDEGKPIKGALVKFSYGNKVYYGTSDDYGIASINAGILPVGKHYFTIEYGGQSIINELNVYSTINSLNYTGDYSNFNVSAKFIDYNGLEIMNREVTFKIGSDTYKATTNADGFATVTVKNLDTGTGKVIAINPITGEQKSMDVVIAKANPQITLTKSQNGIEVTLVATLSSTSAGGNMIFTIGDTKYTVPVKNGKATLNVNNLMVGSYVAYASYSGDDNFNNALSSSLNIVISDTVIKIEGSDLTAYYSVNNVFKVRVTENNNPVSILKVNIQVTPLVEYSSKADNGFISVSLKKFIPGNYVVKVSYGGKTASFNVLIKSTIIVDNQTVPYLSDNPKAKFLDSDGKPLADHVAIFTVNAGVYVISTDSNGVTKTGFSFPIGTYYIYANNPVTGESLRFNMNVTKATPTITLTLKKYNGKYVMWASLSSKYATGKVTFTYGGNSYNVDVNSNGECYLALSEGKTYSITAKYSGNDNFLSVSKSAKVTVPTSEPTIIIKNIKKYYLDSKQFTVRLLDGNGKPMASKTLLFDITTFEKSITSVSKKTDSKGYVKLKFNIKPDDYYVDIYYKGEYLDYGNVLVKKAKSILKVPKKTYKVKTKTKKLTVSLELKEYYLVGQKVTLKVAGKTYKAKTNSKGKATFKITKLKRKGAFTATVKYGGNGYYTKVTKKVKIRVK